MTFMVYRTSNEIPIAVFLDLEELHNKQSETVSICMLGLIQDTCQPVTDSETLFMPVYKRK